MMRTLTFAAGAVAGYVLGTRAGREKYEQIVAGARNFAQQPQVSQAQTKIKEMVGSGKDAVTQKMHTMNDSDGDMGSSTNGRSRTPSVPAHAAPGSSGTGTV